MFVTRVSSGLCVAMPVYYATGNRWRAFSWALLSGVSEPVAALVGWLVLSGVMNDAVYAVLFGVVAGMMVIISVKELLPTAHRYDPEDTVVSYMFITGMAVMAVSLCLFAQLK
jgi:zinc transporter, ZIP family